MIKWFSKLSKTTRNILVFSSWALFILMACVFYGNETSNEFVENNSVLIAIVFLLLLIVAIVFTWLNIRASKLSTKEVVVAETLSFFNENKKEELKKFWKNKFNLFIIIGFSVIVAAIFCVVALGSEYWYVFFIVGMFFIAFGWLCYFIIPTIFFNSKRILVHYVDGVEIGVFIIKHLGIHDRDFDLHLVIGGTDYKEEVHVKYYHYLSSDDILSVLLNAATSIEQAMDIKDDRKNKKNLVKLTKEQSDKTISVVCDKYTKRLILIVDGQIVAKK